MKTAKVQSLKRGGPETTLESLKKSSKPQATLESAVAEVGFSPKVLKSDRSLKAYFTSLDGEAPGAKPDRATFYALYDGDVVLCVSRRPATKTREGWEQDVRQTIVDGLSQKSIGGIQVLAWDAGVYWQTDPVTGEKLSGYALESSEVTWWDNGGLSYYLASKTMTSDQLLQLVPQVTK